MSTVQEVKSFLSHAGSIFKTAVQDIVKYTPVVVATAQKVEAAAQPLLQILLPGVAPELNSVLATIFNAVVSVEQKFAAAGQPTGTGPQKLAEVISIIGPTAQDALAKLGLPADNAAVTNIVNGAVGFLNGIPAGLVIQGTGGATATVTVS